MRRSVITLLSLTVLCTLFSCDRRQTEPGQPHKYHVTFINYNDAVLYEVDVESNKEAIYKGETPTKPEDDEFTYEFEKRDKDLTSIKADLTTKALFKATAKEDWGPIHRFD